MKNKQTIPKIKPIITADIHGISHDGRGITTIDGKTTFVSGALEGEKVSFQLNKKHSRFNEGEVIEILEASTERTTPPCKHATICGGCSLQHMSIEYQLQLKQKSLLEQLKHFGHVEPEMILPPITGKHTAYRRKARLGARYVIKKEKMLIGFREKSSGYLAEIDTCEILDARVGKLLPTIRETIKSLTQFDHIPQIEVAAGDKCVALVFRHMQNLPSEDIEKLQKLGKDFHFDIYLQPNPPAKLQKIWPEDSDYQLNYSLPQFNLEMLFHPLDFTQINAEINLLMLNKALELLDPKPDEDILDLFCGLGNFTLPIARYARKVVGVEGSDEMVSRGNKNAAHNKIDNTEFYAANLAGIPEVKPNWMQRKYDKILLDPPRTGAKEIIEFLPNFNAKRIVYVSCNPATLARDAGELVNKQNWKLKKVGIINMFPHTSHVEAIALFEK